MPCHFAGSSWVVNWRIDLNSVENFGEVVAFIRALDFVSSAWFLGRVLCMCAVN
jgi:hypothetical protein